MSLSGWRRKRRDGRAASLQTTLMLLVGGIIATTLVVNLYVESRFAAHAVETDLLLNARAVGETVARELHAGLTDIPKVDRLLSDEAHSEPDLYSIEVFSISDSGAPALKAVSSSVRRLPASPELLQAVQQGRTISHETIVNGTRAWSVAVPIGNRKHPEAVVGVWVSLRTVDSIVEQARRQALFAAPISVAVLVLFLHFAFARLVHRPVGELERAMKRAEEGDLHATAPVFRRDEVGSVAGRYNRMLDNVRAAAAEREELLGRIRRLNDDLARRVELATRELRAKNRELRRLNEELYDNQRRLRRMERMTVAQQLAASFAHRIGTPLNLISGHVQTLLAGPGADGPVRDRLQRVQSEVDRLTASVRAILDDTRSPVLAIRPLDLNQVLQRVLEQAEPMLAVRNVCRELELGSGLPPLCGDEDQLEQVFLCLLSNSLDAMPQGGTVRVRTLANEGRITLEFSDTGEGIPESVLPRLFKPLFTTKEVGTGTGLGLWIVKEIMTAHGGTIRVASDGATGASFFLEFPAAADRSQAEEGAA